MKNKGFSLIFVLILIALFLLTFAGYIFFKNNAYSEISQLINSDEIQELGVETKAIVMYPGRTRYSLPSGALLTFGRTGTPKAVPDFVYEENYNLNDINNINYIGIKNQLVTYHNGYKYEITNQGCNTSPRFDIDIMITEVTKCKLKYSATKENAPNVNFAESTKKFRIIEHGSPISGLKSSAEELLLYVEANPIRVQQNVKGTYYVEPGENWDVYIITNYGIGEIRFTPIELWNKETKIVKVGEQDVEVSIINLSCNNISDADKNNCPYFTTIDFAITQRALSDKPIKILEYY